jgi:hypothetical protein
VKAYAELYDLELAEVIVDAGESAKHLDPCWLLSHHTARAASHRHR